MSKPRESFAYLLAISLAMVMQLVPAHPVLMALKPWFLGMVVSYYALEQPRMIGLGRAFFFGLCADALSGLLFGEQAMRLCILVYLLFRIRYRIRFFPLWQQTLIVFALFMNDRVIALWLRFLGGYDWPPLSFWLSPFSAALFWPMLYLIFDQVRRWSRT